jgi:hypothetical protein
VVPAEPEHKQLADEEEDRPMRKLLIGVGAAVGAALIARRAAAHCGQFDFERMIERMPDDAPPKWMYRNISAIHANTERILELLETETVPKEARGPAAVT